MKEELPVNFSKRLLYAWHSVKHEARVFFWKTILRGRYFNLYPRGEECEKTYKGFSGGNWQGQEVKSSAQTPGPRIFHFTVPQWDGKL